MPGPRRRGRPSRGLRVARAHPVADLAQDGDQFSAFHEAPSLVRTALVQTALVQTAGPGSRRR